MIDLHCDTLSRITQNGEGLWQNSGQWDVWRARVMGSRVQGMAFFTPAEDSETAWTEIRQQKAYLERQREQPKLWDSTLIVQSAADIEQCIKEYKLGFLLHLEGANALGTKSERLDELYTWGVRSLGLTWNGGNAFADGCLAVSQDKGLTKQGRRLILQMNEYPILLDLAHASPKTFKQALDVSQKPVYVSHANAAGLCKHPRNLNDDQIRAIARQKGVIGLTFYREFLSQEPAGLDTLIDHMAYMADLAGLEVVALGSDFDGARDMALQDVTATVYLNQAMEKRGFYPQEIEQILHGNAQEYFTKNLGEK